MNLPPVNKVGVRMFVTLGKKDQFDVVRTLSSALSIEEIQNFICTNIKGEYLKTGFSGTLSNFTDTSFVYQLF